MEDKTIDEEVVLNNLNDTDDTTVNTDEEDIDDLKARLQKAEQGYQNQKIRAEKAEAQAKAKPAEKIVTSKQGSVNALSAFDLMAVTKADLDEDGLAEVMDFAKYKNITVAEALKSPIMKATLSEKAENRKVAEATNTGVTRRGTSKTSDEALLANARAGQMPESTADIARLNDLRKKF